MNSHLINLTVVSLKDYEKIKNKFSINYGFHQSPFGKCLIGLNNSNVCHFSFVNHSESKSLDLMKREWPGAKLSLNNNETRQVFDRIFLEKSQSFDVLLKGTLFQAKVWHELLNIPRGSTCTYQEVALKIGKPKAVRAAANAVAKNPVGYLVPCHRVVSKNGSIYKYGGGPEIKKKILCFEKN